MWNTVTVQYNPLIEEEFDEHFKVTCEYGYDFWKTVTFPFLDVEWVCVKFEIEWENWPKNGNSRKFATIFLYSANFYRSLKNWIVLFILIQSCNWKSSRFHPKSTGMLHGDTERLWNHRHESRR